MKPRLFIVEGPDCSGKTTLAKHLAVQKEAVYLHASGAKSLHEAMQDYHESLLAIAKANLAMGRNVVMDRFWPSEVVYGQALRPATHTLLYDVDKIIAMLEGHDVIYIFCDDPEVLQRHASQQDPDHPYDSPTFGRIVVNYLQLHQELVDEHFHVRLYSQLTDGKQMGTFVDSL